MGNATTHNDGDVNAFIHRLETLDAGGRARLRRNAARTLNEARNVYPVFYAILPPHITRQEDQEDFFLVATLFPVGTRRDQPAPPHPPANLGASLGLLRQRLVREGRDPERANSLDRRFGALLDADREQMPFRLRQIVSLLAAREIAINWYQLLRDIRRWTKAGRPVQRSWANFYFERRPAPFTHDDNRTLTDNEEA